MPPHFSTGSLHDNEEGSAKCIYLCGNSLGLQPRALSDHVRAHLDTWATKGVNGHFAEIEDSPLPPFLHIDEIAAEGMVDIVGAVTGEVAVMETLTANLHLLMASFYRPTKERYKILIEGKAFPSDHVSRALSRILEQTSDLPNRSMQWNRRSTTIISILELP